MPFWKRPQKKPEAAPKEPFPLEPDRYPAPALLAAWENADRTKPAVALESEDPFFSIEIDGFHHLEDSRLRGFLSQLAEFDNRIQDFCRESYESGQFGAKNYVVALAWVSVESSRRIVLGYWGAYVNMELRAVFESDGQGWERTGISYQ